MTDPNKLLSLAALIEKYAKSCIAGKPIDIERRTSTNLTWTIVHDPSFASQFEWREKPREPRRVHLTYTSDGFLLGVGRKDQYIEKGLEVVEFVEVMKGEQE